MAYIPAEARWYLASLIEEIRVEGDRRNVVHVNTHLIEASSPAEAHRKALRIGRTFTIEYLNPSGKRVRIRFAGIAELVVVYEDLADGAELGYSERVGVSATDLKRMARPRSALAVFAPIARNPNAPDYAAGDIMDELAAMGFSRETLLGPNRRARVKAGKRTARPTTASRAKQRTGAKRKRPSNQSIPAPQRAQSRRPQG